jgi:hypothetical protein
MANELIVKRPGNFKDISGQRFARLTVFEFSHIGKYGAACWHCLCDCGNKIIVSGRNVRLGITKSCGCLQRERARDTQFKHGLINSLEYSSWAHMISRCTNPNTKQFKDWGGRGIKVCERWLNSFEDFISDMGRQPTDGKRYTIERINNDLGYFKENCKWATYKEQRANQRPRKRAIHQ